jgi:hypothetical protein
MSKVSIAEVQIQAALAVQVDLDFVSEMMMAAPPQYLDPPLK